MRSIVCLAIVSGVAHASVIDGLFQPVGRAPQAPAESRRDPPRRLRVNGVELWLAVAESNAPPAQVRRYYEGSEILSFGDDIERVLLAVDRANNPGNGRLLERLGRFFSTDDVNELVRLQLVIFDRRPDGGTTLIHLWPASPLAPDSLSAPARVNHSETPAGPPGFACLLSSGERGEPQALALYEGRGSTSWVLRWFRARLSRDGWREDPDYAVYAERHGRKALRFSRDGHDLYVDVDMKGREGTVIACVIRMG